MIALANPTRVPRSPKTIATTISGDTSEKLVKLYEARIWKLVEGEMY